ncbi:MAG: hypothetical protein AAFY76_10935, partial [Cyanobacteria bacterium J06649_11]
MGKLPKPRFNLKSPKAKRESLIFMIFRYREKKLQYSTGLNIHPQDWDKTAQRPIIQSKRQDLFTIKRELDDLASYCLDIFIEWNYGQIILEDFKRQLDLKTGKAEPLPKVQEALSDRPTFFEFVEEELAGMQAANMKRGSFKIFKRHAAILKEFAIEQFPKGQLFDYEDVDWDFRLKLVDWLTSRNVQLA